MRPILWFAQTVQITTYLLFVLTIVLAVSAQDLGTRDPHAHFEKADAAMRGGNTQLAVQEYQLILSVDRHNVPALVDLGVIYFFEGKWAEAASNLNTAVTIGHSLWKPEALLGMAERRLGDVQKAQLHLAEAFPKLKGDRVQVQAGLELLDLFYADGELDKAAEVIATLKRIAPANPDVLYSAARIYEDLANQARDSLASAAPDSGRMYEIMAQHLVNMGKIDEAIVQYEKALQSDPKLLGVHYELGEAFLHRSHQAEDLDRAEKEFRLAAAENPSDANSRYQIGFICELRDDLGSARQFFSRALQLQPDHAMAHLSLGSVLLAMGEQEAAFPHLLAAARLDPSNPSVHYKLSLVYRKLGHTSDATRESAEFQKLRQNQKHIEQMYLEMHEGVPSKYEQESGFPEPDK